jgi:hypothetical protein
MIDDWLLSLLYAAWLTASTMPLGFMLGSSCSPCCGGCGVADGKPRTDPEDEGTWVPSGTWRGVGGVTWTFNANPGDDSGETWFFYGSFSTSKVGGVATLAERRDWGNICNWYSNKTTSPSTLTGVPGAFDKRATRLPPVDAVVHIYTDVSTLTVGPQVVKSIYFWSISDLLTSSEITSTAAAHDSDNGAVFNDNSDNEATVNGGATFNDNSRNTNFSTVNGGAVFNDNSRNTNFSTVNGSATFNDAACSTRVVGSLGFFGNPCTRKFVAHTTDLPTCNGTAPDGCANAADTCGCG